VTFCIAAQDVKMDFGFEPQMYSAINLTSTSSRHSVCNLLTSNYPNFRSNMGWYIYVKTGVMGAWNPHYHL